MLNIISKRLPAINTIPPQATQWLGEKDAVLLMGDGVYCQEDTFGQATVYAIDLHRSARGLPKLSAVNYIAIDKMVELSTAHTPIITW